MAHILASMEAASDNTVKEYDLDLRWVMSFHLVPHLPRLIIVKIITENRL